MLYIKDVKMANRMPNPISIKQKNLFNSSETMHIAHSSHHLPSHTKRLFTRPTASRYHWHDYIVDKRTGNRVQNPK